MKPKLSPKLTNNISIDITIIITSIDNNNIINIVALLLSTWNLRFLLFSQNDHCCQYPQHYEYHYDHNNHNLNSI